DRLLPAWFTKLHAKYKTPVNSILFVGVVALVICGASLTGVQAHEAFQLIDNAGGVFYALTYLILFAIPLFGMKALGVKVPWWLKIACISGIIATLIYIRYSPNPITEVPHPETFGLKVIIIVVVGNIVGVALYVLRKRK